MIHLNGYDLTNLPEHKRARFLGRVFQDPMMGTAATMGIEENLALAYRRGQKRGLGSGITNEERELYREKLATLGLGLENRMTSKVGLLSGGQRQALTLLMATLRKPDLLLLDEHTAALDPKTADKVLQITEEIVARDNLTTLMVTHNMKNAIQYGNRLIMMDAGHVVVDIRGEEKKNLTVRDLLEKFNIESDRIFAQQNKARIPRNMVSGSFYVHSDSLRAALRAVARWTPTAVGVSIVYFPFSIDLPTEGGPPEQRIDSPASACHVARSVMPVSGS